MKDCIVKRSYYRLDFELITPFAISKQTIANFSTFDEKFVPIIQAHTIASAFHNYIPSPTKNYNSNIFIYDAPFYTYKIKLIKHNNKEIISIDKGSIGSIYIQMVLHKKNVFNIDNKKVYVGVNKAEDIIDSYLARIKTGLRTGAITLGGYKKLNFGRIRVIDVHEKIFDKYNVDEYLNFSREEWMK